MSIENETQDPERGCKLKRYEKCLWTGNVKQPQPEDEQRVSCVACGADGRGVEHEFQDQGSEEQEFQIMQQKISERKVARAGRLTRADLLSISRELGDS